jgi:chemotaxis protein MotB
MERWLLSYADFITLLMVFFILMYALSKVDVAKYNAIAESLSMILTGSSATILESAGPSMLPGNSGEQVSAGINENLISSAQLAEVQRQVEEFIRKDPPYGLNSATGQNPSNLADYIIIMEQERGLVISIKDTLLFSSGSDELNPHAREIITQLGKALVKIPNHIRVEGHTDNLPINNSKFPSNWELSALRAANVLHVLQDEVRIPPERLAVIGYGEYRPLVANQNSLSQSINRRVDIVILKNKYEDFEPNGVQ